VDGRVQRDPEQSADPAMQRITLDGRPVEAATRLYVAINKPRGVVTTAADEHGRDTVYTLLKDAGLPWLGPVGRLDKASEGLLLLSNDSVWAAQLTEPSSHVEKTYHVQIDCIPDELLLNRLRIGVVEQGEQLLARRVLLLRQGIKNAWLEVVLDEGRNRHIRRLLAAHDIGVLRLIRVAIGSLPLGKLAKGAWRHLTAAEISALGSQRSSAENPRRTTS